MSAAPASPPAWAVASYTVCCSGIPARPGCAAVRGWALAARFVRKLPPPSVTLMADFRIIVAFFSFKIGDMVLRGNSRFFHQALAALSGIAGCVSVVE